MNTKNHVVLLVEDNPRDARLIQRAMEKARMLNAVQVQSDGEAAIEYLAGTPPYDDRDRYPLPELVLLDLKLPRKNGFEVLEWLRAQPGLKRLPVVVLTSSDETPDVSRAYDLGANSYLVKPVESEALVGLLKHVDVYWLVANAKPVLHTD